MENRSTQVEALLNTLQEQKDVYGRIHEVLGAERNFLILADIPSLTENNKLKEALLARSRALEKIRQLKFSQVATAYSLSADMSISSLLPHVEKEVAKKLIEVQAELAQVLQQIKSFNSGNEKLAINARKVIESGLKALKGEVPDSQTYKKQGKLEAGRTPGKIVSKEI